MLGLECSARVLGATRPFGQIFDLTLVPPQEKSLVSLLKYALRLALSTDGLGPAALYSTSAGKILLLECTYHPHRVISMSQTRKQKILGDVKKKRRQRTLTTLIILIALIAIVVVAVLTFHGTPNLVPLPDYLSHCVTGSIYHSHPNLTITINGANFPFPPSGTIDNGCQQPIHTHDATGVLHIETDQNRDYTLGDWFLLWGHRENNPTRAIFNSTQIFDDKAPVGGTHSLTMTVNGSPDTKFDKHVFPHNAAPSTALCVVQPCVQDDIVITYS